MAATPAWPVLQTGSSGKNVSALQCLLTFQGYSLTIDGSFGSGTQTAVINFQRSKNLSPDGVAGQNTLLALIVTVQNGANNYAARAAQYLLSKFETITVDGAFGSNSTAVTVTFQQKMGISSDGIVGPTTWQYLFGYDVYPGTPPSGTVYASVCAGSSTLSTAQRAANAAYVYNYLRGQGFTKQAACGVLGNMQQESGINPGIWQVLNNTGYGYGLVQWTPATVFLNRAVDTGVISAANAATINALTNSDPKKLMDAELACLIWCCTTRGDFFAPTAGGSMDHTGYRMTFSQFKASTLDAGTLAKVFHDHYERSADGASGLNTRATNAISWYNTL